jgi:gas vesicle protein
MSNKGKIATGFFIGAFLGAMTGLLFAPKKGSKTRAMIADKANDFGSTMKKNYEFAKEKMGFNNIKEKELLVEN